MLANLINYRIFLFSATSSFGLGLFMPFWIVFIQDFGSGIEQFGFTIGLMVLAQSVTSYFAVYRSGGSQF